MSLQSVTNLGYGGSGQNDALPKAVAELQGLTFSLVAGAAADTEIAITGMEAEDTVVKVLNLTDLTTVDIAHVSVGSRHASGTLTVESVEDGDVIVVNGKTYTFRDVVETIAYNAAPNIIPFQSDPSGANDETATALRLSKVLMSSDSALSASAADNVVTVTWRVAGTVGNAKTLVVSGAGGRVTRSATTLLGGAATNGLSISDDTATKTLLVIWYNKTP